MRGNLCYGMDLGDMKRKVKEGRKANRGFDRVLLCIGTVFLVVFLVAGYFLLRYYGAYQKQKEMDTTVAALREVPQESGREGGHNADDNGAWQEIYERNFIRLKAMNPDYMAWITVPDTDLYYPVVQRDNSYYLNHDFKQQVNSHGAIFMDESCSQDDGVILLHGHHMKDGTMFGGLKKYKREKFRQEHDILYLDWGNGDETYKVFAAALIDLTDEEYFHYNELPDKDEDTEEYLRELKRNSFWYDDNIEIDGQVVLLSTCEYGTAEQRLVIGAVAKEVR